MILENWEIVKKYIRTIKEKNIYNKKYITYKNKKNANVFKKRKKNKYIKIKLKIKLY